MSSRGANRVGTVRCGSAQVQRLGFSIPGVRVMRGNWTEMTGEAPILIAYDGSDPERQCISEAAELFESRPIVVMTVWEPGLGYTISSPASPLDGLSPGTVDVATAQEVDEAVHGRAEQIAKDGADLARSAGLQAEAVAVAEATGVSSAITDQAEEIGAAAIVIGSRGSSGLRARLEGSTSSRVVKHARCPVLLVHRD